MRVIAVVFSLWMALGAPLATAGEPPAGRPGAAPVAPCRTPQPHDPAEIRDAPGPLADPALWAPRRVDFESTLSRSGVWDGALVIDRESDLETRVWWQNLTGKDYDSVLWRPEPGVPHTGLDSEPSVVGITFRRRF